MNTTRKVIKEFEDGIVNTIITADVNSELEYEITAIDLQTNYGDTISYWSVKSHTGHRIKDLDPQILEYFENEFSESIDISDWINAKDNI